MFGNQVRKSIAIQDAKISFVSLVDKPANGRTFLIKKQKGQTTMNVNRNGQITLEKAELEGLLLEMTQAIIESLDSEQIAKAALSSIFGEDATVTKSNTHYLAGIL